MTCWRPTAYLPSSVYFIFQLSVWVLMAWPQRLQVRAAGRFVVRSSVGIFYSSSTKSGVTVKESREYVTHPFIYVTDVTQGVCRGYKKPRQPALCRVKKDRRRTGLSPSEGHFFAGVFYSPGTLCVTSYM